MGERSSGKERMLASWWVSEQAGIMKGGKVDRRVGGQQYLVSAEHSMFKHGRSLTKKDDPMDESQH